MRAALPRNLLAACLLACQAEAQVDRPYDGAYTPACLGADGEVVRLEGDDAPRDGELLTVATGDPAIKDRSLSALAVRWHGWLDGDFRYDCRLEGFEGPQMCSPVTYWYDYQAWLSGGKEGPPPDPHVFLYVPSHPAFETGAELGCRFDVILARLEAVRAIPDLDDRMRALHALISWLKGDERVTSIAGLPVPPLRNSDVTGMGRLYMPAMVFPAAPRAGLPEPSLATALEDLLRRIEHPTMDYAGAYTAAFAVGQPVKAYEAFVRSAPWAALYEDLRHTDDPLSISGFDLVFDPARRQNTARDGADPGQALRGLVYAAPISGTRDELGRPVLNGRVQRPPSGLCLEESSFFFHTSMLHTLDGGGVVGWTRSADLARDLPLDFIGEDGICAAWNRARAAEDRPGDESLEAWCALPAAHAEIYDAHVFIPHGRIGLVRERLDQLEWAAKAKIWDPDQWAMLGYRVPQTWPCTAENPCSEDDLRVLDAAECGGDPDCEMQLASVFHAAYNGPTTRLASGIAPEHLPAQDPARSFVFAAWNDPLAETARDTLACRAGIDGVRIDDPECRFPDRTPPPPLTTGRSSVLGEPVLFMFNHLWLYGSMQPIHEPRGVDRHLPRYWSANGQSDPALAGLVSYREFGEDRPYPPDATYGAAWFVRDVHDYFRQEAPEAMDARGQVDRAKIARSGRGDVMYQLQYTPERLLTWTGEGEAMGTNLPDPSFPRPEERDALADVP